MVGGIAKQILLDEIRRRGERIAAFDHDITRYKIEIERLDKERKHFEGLIDRNATEILKLRAEIADLQRETR